MKPTNVKRLRPLFLLAAALFALFPRPAEASDYRIKAGLTSFVIEVFFEDSSVTTGAGLTGITSSSSGLKMGYKRTSGTAYTTGTISAITTLGTFAGSATAFGIKEVDATNAAGLYEIDVPNNAIATGDKSVEIMIWGAANLRPARINIELVAYDPQDSVRAGLTALPNAAAATTGGLPIVGTGTGAISLSSGNVTASSVIGNILGNLNGSVAGTVTAVSSGVQVTSYASGQDPATLVLGAAKSSWTGSTTIGGAINAAGSAGDPWITSLPGAYGAGTAGFLVGTYLDAAVSSRSAYAGGDTSGVTTLVSRLSSTRAGYLDNLSFLTATPPTSSAIATSVWGAGTRSLTDKAGFQLDLTQSVPTSNTAQTVGDALNAARAQGFGKWIISGTIGSTGATLKLYAPDGTTLLRTFDMSTAGSRL